MLKKILITGSSGKLGRALTAGLAPQYEIIEFDLPESDVTDYRLLKQKLQGCFGLVHLAFDYRSENSRSGRCGNPENLLMGQIALAATAKANIKKCIMASSVNAARTRQKSNWSYRGTKLSLEGLAAEYAERHPDTDFTSIRFGRVTADDQPPEEPLREDQTWISHSDAVGLVQTILEAEPIPEHTIVYGISNRASPPYDLKNPWNWVPQDYFGNL